jgi:AmmeMemoRadiSam system protein A
VASSDLSHFYPYDVAKGLDTTCVKAICGLNIEWMERQEACGKAPILTLMHIARQKGWKARLLDYRNSGDTAGDKSRVVGYAAIAFYAPDGAGSSEEPSAQADKAATLGRAQSPATFTSNQQKYLLELARRTIDKVVIDKKLPELPMDAVSDEFLQPAAVFVTLTKEGRLRGCIGDIFPRRPLYRAVIFSAAGAAAQDRRFPPVRPSELDQIEVEVSVLTLPQRLEFSSPQELLDKLRPKVDGVVLRVGQKQSTYLPQVWEQLPDKVEFLNRLAEKAGLSPSAWKDSDATVLVYQVKAFKENESEM